ncbi:MAG: hypothetical protein CVV33_06255, partial [Methanomicrobiales archaeon HGW-Methanomicrobiales-4]
NQDLQIEQSVPESVQPEAHQPDLKTPVGSVDLPPPKEIPSPIPPPLLSNISDWNPYNVLPTPEPVDIRPSILKNDTQNNQVILNTTYSGSVGLGGYAIGKDLNITTGPFSITYSVHPNVTSPLLVWTRFTVYDPWQNVIAEEGYNRGYTSDETKTMMIYREGRYYLTIEGEFASVDYTIKTGDPAPAVTRAPIPVEMEGEEEMMMRMQG